MANFQRQQNMLLQIADYITANETNFIREYYYTEDELKEIVLSLLKIRAFLLQLSWKMNDRA